MTIEELINLIENYPGSIDLTQLCDIQVEYDPNCGLTKEEYIKLKTLEYQKMFGQALLNRLKKNNQMN